MLYPIWFISFNDNNHFTLFIIHTIHQNNSFEQSYVFYFNSLPSFQSDINSHINIIKELVIVLYVELQLPLIITAIPWRMIFYYKIIVFKILLIVYQEISSYHISNTYCLKKIKNYSNIFIIINKYKFTWYYNFDTIIRS